MDAAAVGSTTTRNPAVHVHTLHGHARARNSVAVLAHGSIRTEAAPPSANRGASRVHTMRGKTKYTSREKYVWLRNSGFRARKCLQRKISRPGRLRWIPRTDAQRTHPLHARTLVVDPEVVPAPQSVGPVLLRLRLVLGLRWHLILDRAYQVVNVGAGGGVVGLGLWRRCSVCKRTQEVGAKS